MNVFVADPVSRFWFESFSLKRESLPELRDVMARKNIKVSEVHEQLTADLLACHANLCGHSAGHPDHWRRA